jgi:hypothetical protein
LPGGPIKYFYVCTPMDIGKSPFPENKNEEKIQQLNINLTKY